MAETLPGFEAYEWNGVFVPTGTPAEIIAQAQCRPQRGLRQPDIAARLKQLNVEFRENTPEEFRAFVAAEMEKWGRVVGRPTSSSDKWANGSAVAPVARRLRGDDNNVLAASAGLPKN